MRKKRKRRKVLYICISTFILIAVILVLIHIFYDPGYLPAKPLMEPLAFSAKDNNPNFYLYAGISIPKKRIFITVSIDGQFVVKDTFYDSGIIFPGHYWVQYKLVLPRGNHRISATASDWFGIRTRATLNETFEVTDTQYGTLSHYGRSFDFSVENERPMFK